MLGAAGVGFFGVHVFLATLAAFMGGDSVRYGVDARNDFLAFQAAGDAAHALGKGKCGSSAMNDIGGGLACKAEFVFVFHGKMQNGVLPFA